MYPSIALYKYDGKEGVLVYSDNKKVANIAPLAEGENGINFYELAQLKEIMPDDVCVVNSDAYNGEVAEQGGEIDIHLIRNPENEQKLIYDWEYDDVAEDDEAVRQLNTYTSQYHDWKSELTSFVENAEANKKNKSVLEKEWEEIKENYTFHFSEPLSFDAIWEEIEYRRDK